MTLQFTDKALRHDDLALLEDVGEGIELDGAPTDEPSGTHSSAFFRVHAKESNSRLVFDLGRMPALDRFSACHRYEPYWMKPVAGTQLDQVPSETQSLLVRLKSETKAAKWLLLVPLFGERLRFSLRAAFAGFSPSVQRPQRLELLGETGDPMTPATTDLALFVAVGEDPFALCEEGAAKVMQRLSTGRLRKDKPLPDFCELFGWCTWDAFYQEVSHDKVREGLSRFKEGGVEPRFLILDDGWQSRKRMPTGEQRLTAFAANEKFEGGLAKTVRMAKDEFAVQRLLVWHTMVGYWGGMDAQSFPEYDVRDRARRFGEGIMEHRPGFNEQWWGGLVGLPSQDKAAQFFDDYHTSLLAQGVDGVKVDSQSVLEGVAFGEGGRVPLTLAFRKGLEGSVAKHFDGRLINCMSNGQETWYAGRSSTLLRSSIDFFPGLPESHGAHLYANAQVGVWFGQFMHPDWDMFQSGHEWGPFHAAGRAISGGPVYCSDKPGVHDFSLLRKLVCFDGSVLLCDRPGLPTLDTLCRDPTSEEVLCKLQNTNGAAGVVGAFHCRYSPSGAAPITGVVAVRDALPGVQGPVACFRHNLDALELLATDAECALSLKQGEFELFHFVPVVDGFAAIGLADKFNSTGAVVACRRGAQSVEVSLRDGGVFVAYSKRKPTEVRCDGSAAVFAHDATTGRLNVAVPEGARRTLSIAF